MCKECEGLGFVQTVRIDTLIDKHKALNEGAIMFPTFQPGGWRLTRYTLSGCNCSSRLDNRYRARSR